MKRLLPFLAWSIWLLVAGSAVLQSNWETALVVFAAWVLVPEGLHVLRIGIPRTYWATVLLLSISYAFPAWPEWWRAIAAAPYAGFSTWLAVREMTQLLVVRKLQLIDFVKVAALAFWSVGALFGLSFLSGFRPLGFDLVIVSLTAAHFHMAGFVLSVIVYCMMKAAPGTWTRLTGWAVLLGMPAVATGIVLTLWGYSPVFEWVAALFFACFALTVVVWHLLHSGNNAYPIRTRLFWILGSVCLLAGASLASLYALRFEWPIAWINIPNMKIWHGTLNTLGFGWLTLTGWRNLNTYNRTNFP